MNGILAKRANYLYGIVNGIDYEINNPETDKMLFANYSANDLKGKAYNKRKLQESAKLPVKTDVPLIGIISRLVGQKGFDLLDCILDELLSEDVQIIVLGTGDYQYEEMFRSAAHRYPHKISATIDYNSLLSQRIYAGSDMFLMPSLFEPCGLSQMISLRYGTIPIVRETGGLKDTITSYNEVTDEGNGFTFTNYNAHDMLYTIRRAISFYHQKNIWNKLVKRAMHCDFSWEASAGEYLKLYKSLIRLP